MDYKSSSLDEKRTILSEAFNAYKNINHNNYNIALEALSGAESLFGSNEVLTEVKRNIKKGNKGKAKQLLELLINELINSMTPFENVGSD